MRLKVKVEPKGYNLDNTFNKRTVLSFYIKTNKYLTRENKDELINKICRLIELEIENDELLKEKSHE